MKNEIEKRKLLREKENQQKIDGVLNGLQTIANLTELFSDKNKKAAKAAFEMNKGVQIAQTAIDTYKGAMSAYSAVASIPIVGPALGIAASAAVISAGLLNIKKIAAQKFEGGNIDKTTPATPSYNGITMNTPAAPVPPSLSLFGTQMTGSSGGNEQGVGQRQQPIRAYVVENDITETQERLNLYKNRAEIG